MPRTTGAPFEAPPFWMISALQSQMLPLLYAALGSRAQVSSWYRTQRANRAVGGDAESQHLMGLAMDFVGDAEAIERAAQARGLIAVRESDHTHVQVFPRGALARAGVRFALLP